MKLPEENGDTQTIGQCAEWVTALHFSEKLMYFLDWHGIMILC